MEKLIKDVHSRLVEVLRVLEAPDTVAGALNAMFAAKQLIVQATAEVLLLAPPTVETDLLRLTTQLEVVTKERDMWRFRACKHDYAPDPAPDTWRYTCTKCGDKQQLMPG